MPASFAGRSAYNEIVGPDGLAVSDSLRFGLFLQAPESFYPPHRHAAEEFYYVLSGAARWQKGEEAPSLKPPGSCIRHAPWERHAMETAAQPLLALWVWTGDLDMASYEMEEAPSSSPSLRVKFRQLRPSSAMIEVQARFMLSSVATPALAR